MNAQELALFEKTFLKTFGDESIIDLKKQPAKGEPGTFISTGSVSLDLAIGIGGLPRGRVVEIFGPEATGKSTLALNATAEGQRAYADRGPCAYIDCEQAMNREYAEMIGLELGRKGLLFTQEQNAEKALNMVSEMAKAGLPVIVLDSVASLIAESELEGEDVANSKFGGVSKLMSSSLRHIVNSASKSDSLVIFINQLREKVGQMFGNPETTPGGRALKYYSTVRLDVRNTGQIKDSSGQPQGVNVKVKTVKNKVSAPFRTAEYELFWGKGIDRAGDLLNAAESQGLLTKRGSHIDFGEIKLGNGRPAAVATIREDEKLRKALTDTLWAQVNA